MRRSLASAALAVAAVGLLAGCGSAPLPKGTGTATPTASTTVVERGDLLVGRGMLMQRSAASPAELCLGPVAASYPPSCSGLRVVGEVDWDRLGAGRANGVTWTNASVWAVGRLDADAGGEGTITLDRPVSLIPPTGVTPPATEPPPRLPQLCDDPYAGGGRPGTGSAEAQNAVTERLPRLDGYIGSWVSDGSSLFNVLVTGEAAAAHAALREVWRGGLCVEQRDLPTEARVLAALDAVARTVDGVITSGPRPTGGGLEVHVTALDSAVRDLVVETVAPWLAPEDVTITSALQPFPG
jgi:hypothetical protein